jgi:hypothetical protein
MNNLVNGVWDYSKEVRVPIIPSLRNGRNVSVRFTFNGNTIVVRKISI